MKISPFLLMFSTALNSGAYEAHPPAPALTDTPGFCIFGGWSGKPFNSGAAFKSVIWKSDIIYVGETRGQPKDRLAQLEALKALREARGSKIVVGFEMLNMTLQPVLDDYTGGKTTEEEFLQKAGWEKEWDVDFNLYKPLFDFIRENKLKALALNLPKKIVLKIAREGLPGLTPEEKQYLPEKVEITKHKKYADQIKKSFEEHGDNPKAEMFKFENYLAAMCAWNEAMGARLADFMNRNPGYSALALVGNGHVLYNAAMPASVKARGAKLRQASFYTKDVPICPGIFPKEHKDMANYIWYMAHPKKPEPVEVQTTTAAVEDAPVASTSSNAQKQGAAADSR